MSLLFLVYEYDINKRIDNDIALLLVYRLFMPKRTDLETILIIGAGPIVIGQACEFDYSGTQACRALREEGYRVVLVNSNPATIMTDPEIADRTYIEPLELSSLSNIIAQEKPDALLATVGGQTALNKACELDRAGVLANHNVQLIGASISSIETAEDRWLFKETVEAAGLSCPRAIRVSREAQSADALAKVGLPAIIRPDFTLGGSGGGIAYNKEQLSDFIKLALKSSPSHSATVEESVIGWKEFEMEVVRDHKDNAIIVCSIENFDPMGVHTGDSITVAPALTLSDKELQIMRDASIEVLRRVGVDTGGANVQFAINPRDGTMLVIEMNPRVSRSSALASKATGFPIAKIAAKLAVGYSLDELSNDMTRTTPASFEPALDYVVVKIPRFDFEKFPGAERTLTTHMKSVGEAMAIGRSFDEALQKALRSMEIGLSGFDNVLLSDELSEAEGIERIERALLQPCPERILFIAEALRRGMAVEDIARLSSIDPWFLRRIAGLIEVESQISAHGKRRLRGSQVLSWKRCGFSDARIAFLTGRTEEQVRKRRQVLGVRAVYRRIDSCAAEFPAHSAYMYGSYGEGLSSECESDPSDREKIVILGGGPNRIGQGIEFDYCCVHASLSLRALGYETIMVNCNPETVSTDYDISDRLYFEPVTEEDVFALLHREREKGKLLGVIVQLGGQTPLKISRSLEREGFAVLGTTPDAIDLAENRSRFGKLLTRLGLRQPKHGSTRGGRAGLRQSLRQAMRIAKKIGYPVLVRPSYVLGGRAMEIVFSAEHLKDYMAQALRVSGRSPVLIDSYLRDAIELDVDALCDGEDCYIAGVLEHIEEAGVHSGDSACVLPSQRLEQELITEIERQTAVLGRSLQVRGLLNVQFAVLRDEILILEVNPRASRSVPFIAKATGVPLVRHAISLICGERLSSLDLPSSFQDALKGRVAVKESVFPFARFPGSDIVLGPEMRSTGEVMGLSRRFSTAFAKAQLGAGIVLPRCGRVFLSLAERDKPFFIDIAVRFVRLGFTLVATRGTAQLLKRNGVVITAINRVAEGSPHILDSMINGEIAMIFNTMEGRAGVQESRGVRQMAFAQSIPYVSTRSGARAVLDAIEQQDEEIYSCCCLQELALGASEKGEAGKADDKAR